MDKLDLRSRISDVRKNKIPIFLYIAIIVLGTGVLAVGWWNVYLKNSKKTTILAPKKLTNMEMAKRTVAWLDTQRNEKGEYPFSCSCSTKECTTCIKQDVSWREGPFVIWGRYKYYQKTNSSNDLVKINQELDNLISKPMQFEDWNCRILLDLWQDSKLSEETKQKVVKLCANDGRVSVDFNFIKNPKNKSPDLDNDDINESIRKIISKEQVGVDENLYNLIVTGWNFPKYAFFASENIAKKIVLAKKNEAEDTKVSFEADSIKSNFKYALYGYSLININKPSVYHNAVLGIAALDMYRYYGDPIYLEFAGFLYQKNKVLEIKPGYLDLAYQILFLEEMKKERYMFNDEIQRNITVLTDNFFNRSLNAFAVGDRLNIKENGLIVGLLADK